MLRMPPLRDPQAGLTVDHRAGLLKGGDHGTAVTRAIFKADYYKQSDMIKTTCACQRETLNSLHKPSPISKPGFGSGAKDPRIDPPNPLS